MKFDKSRHSSTIAFLDFVFNLVLAFVTLVILLLLIIKAESAKPTPENKNEFIITVQWDDGTNDDVDTWVRDPNGEIISFQRREVPGMHLQRDDVGRANKKVTTPDGLIVEDPRNIEIVNINKWIAGTYTVNLHLYRPHGMTIAELHANKPSNPGEIHVDVKLIKINPYGEAAKAKLVLDRAIIGQEKTAFNFTVDAEGKVTSVNNLPIEIVKFTPGSVQESTELPEPPPSIAIPR